MALAIERTGRASNPRDAQPVTSLDIDGVLVLPSFHLALPSFICVILDFQTKSRNFTKFYWVLLSFTGFYWVLLGFNRFHRVFFTGLYLASLFY